MMNERIRKLAKQADKWAAEEFHQLFLDNINADRQELFNKKFAELLIRECINIAYEYDKPKLSGPGLAIASYIESHFDIYIEEDGRFVK